MQYQVLNGHHPVSRPMRTYVQHLVLSRLVFGKMLEVENKVYALCFGIE